jgi:branched-chain amino acid transport system substrate-binding protein
MARHVGVAQQKERRRERAEQFFPVLVYRTGPYGPNGTPWANGYVDYLKLVNA